MRTGIFFFLDYVDQRDNSLWLEKNIHVHSIIWRRCCDCKDFETRKGEWDVRDVVTIPEVLFKEYNNYGGRVDSDFHDEQVEVKVEVEQ